MTAAPHIPVLLTEAVAALAIQPGETQFFRVQRRAR